MSNLEFFKRVFTCLLIISVLTAGCRDKDSEQVEPNITTTEPAGSGSDLPDGRRPLDILLSSDEDNEVAVTVNGVEIKEGQILEIIAPDLRAMADSPQAANLSIDVLNEQKKLLRDSVLQQLIIWELLDPKVESANIVVTKEEAESIFKEQLTGQPRPISIEEFKETVEKYGGSYDKVLQRFREGLAYDKFVEAQINDMVNVAEEEAQKFYDENKKSYEIPEQVRASHILVSASTDDPNEAKEKIEDLLRQVKDGADFAELAKATGGFPSAPDGGDLGFFPKGVMVEPFNTVAFELEVGQVSDVVETQYGYHIIKVTDHKEAETSSFEEEKDKIIEELTMTKKIDSANKYIESLVAEATIEFPEGKELKSRLFAQ